VSRSNNPATASDAPVAARIVTALRLTGQPPPRGPRAFRRIGSGAWHNAYLVQLEDGGRVVVRLRKAVIYGQRRPHHPPELADDYAPVGLYYQRANDTVPGVCPATYEWFADVDVAGTVESYMGRPVDLAGMRLSHARDFGHAAGHVFRALHARPVDIPGFGLLLCRDGRIVTEDSRPVAAIVAERDERCRQQLAALAGAGLVGNVSPIRQALEEILVLRRWQQEPPALVNRDITPENLIARRGRFAGLVDPVPLIHNGLHFAGQFLACYRYLLPARARAPRYAGRGYGEYAHILAAIADGYAEGYAGGDPAVAHALAAEQLLSLIDWTHEHLALSRVRLSEEMRLRAGEQADIERSVLTGAQLIRAAVAG
jgi:hypothetical protein